MLLKMRGICALTALLALAACTTAPTRPNPVAVKSATAAEKNLDVAEVDVPALETYLGQGPGYLTGLFGAPTLRRQEAGVELWQYAGTTCVVLFYLYGDSADDLAIEHLEARNREGGAPADDTTYCLKEVAATKGSRPVA